MSLLGTQGKAGSTVTGTHSLIAPPPFELSANTLLAGDIAFTKQGRLGKHNANSFSSQDKRLCCSLLYHLLPTSSSGQHSRIRPTLSFSGLQHSPFLALVCLLDSRIFQPGYIASFFSLHAAFPVTRRCVASYSASHDSLEDEVTGSNRTPAWTIRTSHRGATPLQHQLDDGLAHPLSQ